MERNEIFQAGVLSIGYPGVFLGEMLPCANALINSLIYSIYFTTWRAAFDFKETQPGLLILI